MAEGRFVRQFDRTLLTAADAVAAYEMWQTPDGRAGVNNQAIAGTTGDNLEFLTAGKFTVPKTTGAAVLDGGRVYWDYSANTATFKKVNDRDFYLGRAIGDWLAADSFMVVDLNVDPPYDIDLARDPVLQVPVGTQALGGLLLQRKGGAFDFTLSSTNEAQKLDMLSQDGFSVDAKAIVEFCFNVASDGAGTVVDVSMGVANGTHATDADSITESVFIHLDANNTQINAESDDGTTEVAATDTTTDYTEGNTVATRVEVWIDMRDKSDINIYVNGVQVLTGTTFTLAAAVGPLYLLTHIEKTASTDTYQLALNWMRARYTEQ